MIPMKTVILNTCPVCHYTVTMVSFKEQFTPRLDVDMRCPECGRYIIPIKEKRIVEDKREQ